jgi:type III secretion system FlhB-like substrate exporter
MSGHRAKKMPAGQLAASIRYRPDENQAPLVSEIGDRETAALMAKTAQKYGIPVVVDQQLAGELSAVGKNREIPARMFQTIARILVAARPRKAS